MRRSTVLSLSRSASIPCMEERIFQAPQHSAEVHFGEGHLTERRVTLPFTVGPNVTGSKVIFCIIYSYAYSDSTECNGTAHFKKCKQLLQCQHLLLLRDICGLYYKCFMIVIYNCNDSGQYYKPRIKIVIDDSSLSQCHQLRS